MTKPIVTFAALKCVELGLIDLDKPVHNFHSDLKDLDVGKLQDGKVIYEKANKDITLHHLLAHTSGFAYDFHDPLLAHLALEEKIQNEKELQKIEGEIMIQLLPKDKDDERNSFVELRAGAGGDEAAIFVGDLYRMYSRFSERNNWKVEKVKEVISGPGGFKEIIAKISGKLVYKTLKFESGVHRVQRVPETESQGRVHTSTCTVAVLPEAEEIDDVEIDKSEIRVDTFRASGAGGQHVNKTDSAVRITHLPSGLVVECQDGRSQHKNKTKALSLLSAKLKKEEEENQQAEIASERKILVGSGDRSEKIRTYNFPQGRVTDHRIKLTQHNLDQVMDGDIRSISDALIAENQLEMLAQLELDNNCLLYTSPSPRDRTRSRMPSSA